MAQVHLIHDSVILAEIEMVLKEGSLLFVGCWWLVVLRVDVSPPLLDGFGSRLVERKGDEVRVREVKRAKRTPSTRFPQRHRCSSIFTRCCLLPSSHPPLLPSLSRSCS